MRSSTRSYPYEEDKDGLIPADLDGDDVIRQMRIADPNGDWKASETEPRRLVKRQPEDIGSPYYRVYTEGLVNNYDGFTLKVPPDKAGLDLNRNYPYDWTPDNEQPGAGPFPLSEPETRAVVEFWANHRNITGCQSYHTFAGVILRPYSGKPDDAFNSHDLRIYNLIGKRGLEYTGYPSASIYHDFRYDPKTVLHGAFLDWAYEHQGVFSISTELWDIIALAGIEKREFINFLSWEHSDEDDLKIYTWLDENVPGAFKAWTPFEHPQLGPVEVGGWDFVYSWQNPPPGSQFLKDIMERNMRFSFACCAMSPLLTLPILQVAPVGPNLYRLTAIVENAGFLPTYVSQKAAERKLLRPLTVELELPEGGELVGGEAKVELKHLEGRSNKLSISPFIRGYESDYRAKAELVFQMSPGTSLTVTAWAERAGRVRKSYQF